MLNKTRSLNAQTGRFFVDISNLFCKLGLSSIGNHSQMIMNYSNDLLQDCILHLYGKKLSIDQVKIVVAQNVWKIDIRKMLLVTTLKSSKHKTTAQETTMQSFAEKIDMTYALLRTKKNYRSIMCMILCWYHSLCTSFGKCDV